MGKWINSALVVGAVAIIWALIFKSGLIPALTGFAVVFICAVIMDSRRRDAKSKPQTISPTLSYRYSEPSSEITPLTPELELQRIDTELQKQMRSGIQSSYLILLKRKYTVLERILRGLNLETDQVRIQQIQQEKAAVEKEMAFYNQSF